MLKNNFKNFLDEISKNHNKLYLLENEVNESINIIYKTILKGGKILICGNGGSAADAQHLAAEFLVRLRPNINRKPIAAISLALDTSTITACGNDYDFNLIFSRNFEALAKKRDLLICLSTSGNSKNIINVLKKAKELKIEAINFLGFKGGKAKKFTRNNLIVPFNNTARVQEAHIMLGHYIFEKVEELILKKTNFDKKSLLEDKLN
ncbi:SIS domain-containing protein [Candidatus Pelagibacter bacterium]|jgi:D-sedoheptulose 7-phosphate isomerase|nr:SIS domain-containing protein [Candidatus Pelagibacter bacterium]MDA8835048.1 SIS domain-containing protein [Candidatus Pelagibacter bacterium]